MEDINNRLLKQIADDTELDIKVSHEIKAEDFLTLVYMLSSEALVDNGYAEDDIRELTFNMFVEYVEYLANNNETLQLLTGK